MTIAQQNQQQATPFHPLPSPGDIVWCHYPESVQAADNAPCKARPALVSAVSDHDHCIEVCYGTSQKTGASQIYPSEFVLDPAADGFDLSGLATRTKFDTGQRWYLPFNSRWFSKSPGVDIEIPLPKLGVLHPSFLPELRAAVASGRLSGTSVVSMPKTA